MGTNVFLRMALNVMKSKQQQPLIFGNIGKMFIANRMVIYINTFLNIINTFGAYKINGHN